MTSTTVFQTYFPTIGPTQPKKPTFIGNAKSVEWNQYELILTEGQAKIVLSLEELEELMKFLQENIK